MSSHGDSPRMYNHPYKPYDIQIQLMDKIYDTIDQGYKIGIFESPTGTGKTLSLICSTMSWLRNYKRTHHGNTDQDSDSEPEWVNQAYQKSILSLNTGKWMDYERHLSEMAKEYDNKIVKVHELPVKRIRQGDKTPDFLAADYIDDENSDHQLKEEINMLLDKISTKESVQDITQDVKIYFSSRTHSQLSQFTSQLTLPQFETSLDDIPERTKYTPLGSRKQLCINPKVSKLTNLELINDACKELVTHSECSYFTNSRNQTVSQQFTDYSLTKIHDIEDLNHLGEHLKVCPYYSIRNTIPASEIISLPYQMIFEVSTREIMNLDLKNAVVIIDEAHNLLDTLLSMNSVKISFWELQTLADGLQKYFNKFVNRLNSGNRINLMKLIKVVKSIMQFIESHHKQGTIKPGVEIDINDFFVNSTSDLFNVHNLEKYLNKSKIAFKIENYLTSLENHKSSSSPLLFKLIKFLKALNNPSVEGKFFWDLHTSETSGKTINNISLHYMLLDPSEIFRPIVETCKCLILCGGTMEPITDYTNYLFPYIEPHKINTFSCNHMIPDNNLQVIPISSFNDVCFDLTYQNRNNSVVITALGNMLRELYKAVPYGIVVFFPSYKYLHDVLQVWKLDGTYTKLNMLKKIFIEPKSSNDVDLILLDYSSTVTKLKAASLFSVVGGKLSEGINFQDDLARGIIMIGLPYPNIMSGELIAKRKYIETKANPAKANEYVENLCMRAVNQSIGRSIRHIKDYAMIYLIDQRYEKPGIQTKLSAWINKRLARGLSFNQVIDETHEFFMSKSITVSV